MFGTILLGQSSQKHQKQFSETHERVLATFGLVENIRQAEKELDTYITDYRPLHIEVRLLEKKIRFITLDLEDEEQTIRRLERNGETTGSRITIIKGKITDLKAKIIELEAQIPKNWKVERKIYLELAKAETKARKLYRRNVDEAFEPLIELIKVIAQYEELVSIEDDLLGLKSIIANDQEKVAMKKIKAVEKQLGMVAGSSKIKSKISKARRALKRNPDREKADQMLEKGLELFAQEVAWRQQASEQLLTTLKEYENLLSGSIGARLQNHLSKDQAKYIASCLSDHQDVSLAF